MHILPADVLPRNYIQNISDRFYHLKYSQFFGRFGKFYDQSKNPADVLPRKYEQKFSDRSLHVMQSRFFGQFKQTLQSNEKSVRKLTLNRFIPIRVLTQQIFLVSKNIL